MNLPGPLYVGVQKQAEKDIIVNQYIQFSTGHYYSSYPLYKENMLQEPQRMPETQDSIELDINYIFSCAYINFMVYLWHMWIASIADLAFRGY